MGARGQAEPLRVMPDGTVKQINLLSGVEVWTVPGRADRPIDRQPVASTPLQPGDEDRWCAFCPGRIADTPPEKARRVRTGDGWQTLTGVLPGDWDDTVAEFRRIPNLYEIVGYDYWARNYAYRPPAELVERCARYCADPAGRAHLLSVLEARDARTTAGNGTLGRPGTDLTRLSIGLFAGGHDVIVARRHFVPGAAGSSALAGSGSLSPEEHGQYMAFTVQALHELYEQNRHVRQVAVFQNWLHPAGASFDHLHKQLVSIDQRSVQVEEELVRLRSNPNAYNDLAVNVAVQHDLVVAENAQAIAFAGFGHRYPTVEIYSKSPVCEPWLQTGAEVTGMSDLVHACHAATGTSIPCNEEWQHRAPDVDLAMPWRINIKWRVSMLAGFEGDTKIYLNTLDPWQLRDRLVPRLRQLRDTGRLAAGIAVGEECQARYNSLLYNPVLQR